MVILASSRLNSILYCVVVEMFAQNSTGGEHKMLLRDFFVGSVYYVMAYGKSGNRKGKTRIRNPESGISDHRSREVERK